MKKALLILCFTLLLSACANQSNDINSSNGDKPSTTSVSASELDNVPTVNDKIPFDNKGKGDSSSKIPQVKQKLSDEEISKLSTQKCGFGQGLRLDNNNRPYGSLDFNSVFEKYDSYAIVEQSDKVVYLTFDQGYENGYTSVILDTLKEKNVKATFFVLTDYVKRNPELVKRMIDEGHTVGNHSVHHYSMPTLDINTAKKKFLIYMII